jgi:uncharacterized protein
MGKERVLVGHVVALYRHPVKSMRPESIQETKVGWHGLAGDRRFAFLDLSNSTGFPWLTARACRELVTYVPRFENPADPDASGVLVRTPAGCEWPVGSSELLNELCAAAGRPIRLVQLNSGVFDAMAVSLITTTSIADIGVGLGVTLDVRRFRPNIVVQPVEQQPFVEDRWVGDLLVFGDRPNSARIRMNRRDLRCAMVCLDPESAESNPAVLKHVVQKRENNLGLYGAAQFPGVVQVGDDVFRICD